jgi:benzoate/toluate 1,2-dioxygenase beta subunit
MLAYETFREIELFLLKEAHLLDQGEYKAWLELYAPKGVYWMPSQWGQTDPLNVASIMYEDHAILAIRVQRLLEGRSLTLTPKPRSVHTISNVEVLKGEAGSDEFEVGSAFVCVAQHGNSQNIFAGRQTHFITRHGGSFRIARKNVYLLNCDAVHPAVITIPI